MSGPLFFPMARLTVARAQSVVDRLDSRRPISDALDESTHYKIGALTELTRELARQLALALDELESKP